MAKGSENKTVELEEIKSTIFEVAGLVDKGDSLARVIRYMAKELLDDSCPYRSKMRAIIDTLEVETGTAKDILTQFIKEHWGIEERDLEDALILSL